MLAAIEAALAGVRFHPDNHIEHSVIQGTAYLQQLIDMPPVHADEVDSTVKAMFSDPEWLGFTTEPYLFAAAVHFTIAYGMSRYSRHLENALQTDHR